MKLNPKEILFGNDTEKKPVLLTVTPPRAGERTLLGVENMLGSIAVPEPFSLVLQSQVVLGRMRLLYQVGEVRNWPGSGERCWKRPGGPRVLRKCTDALVHVSTGRNPAGGHWPM